MNVTPLPRKEFLATRGSHQARSLDLMARVPALALPHGCPECATGVQFPLAAVVMHLNDNHGWSRGRVADWLDTLDLDLDVYDVPVWQFTGLFPDL